MIEIRETNWEDLYPEDLKLIEMIRAIKFGEITIKLRNSKPVIIEKGIMTIKLEEDARMRW